MQQNLVWIAIPAFLFAGASGNLCFHCWDTVSNGKVRGHDQKCDWRFDRQDRGLLLQCDKPCFVEYKKVAYLPNTYEWSRGCSENTTCEEIWDIDHWRRCCNHDGCNDYTSADATDFPMKQCFACSSTMYNNGFRTTINGSCTGDLTIDMEINRVDCNGFCFAQQRTVKHHQYEWTTWTRGCKETCNKTEEVPGFYDDYFFCCNHHNLCNDNVKSLYYRYYSRNDSIIHRPDIVSVIVTVVLWASAWFEL